MSAAGAFTPARAAASPPVRAGAAVVTGGAVTAVLAALTLTAAGGAAGPWTALGVAVMIAVGEAARSGVRGGQPVAPVATAVGLAYALVPAGGHGVAQTIAVTGAGLAAGAAARGRLLRDEPVAITRPAGRLLVVAFAAVVFRHPYAAGALGDVVSSGWRCVALLCAVAVCTGLFAGVLSAVAEGPRPEAGFAAAVVEGVRTGAGADGIGVLVVATGVPFALAGATLGAGVLPFLGAGLLLVPLALRRRAAAEATRAETVEVLARLTETAGCAAPGRADRCGRLAGEVGRALGLFGDDLDDLRTAARLHDLGRIGGAPGAVTLPAPVLAAAVVRAAGLREEIARLVERQGEPYRAAGAEGRPGVPLAGRVLAVVAAYEDLTAGADDPGTVARALRVLRGSAGSRFDPRAVEALAQVAER